MKSLNQSPAHRPLDPQRKVKGMNQKARNTPLTQPGERQVGHAHPVTTDNPMPRRMR